MLSMLFVQQLMIVLNAKIALGREKIQIKDIVFSIAGAYLIGYLSNFSQLLAMTIFVSITCIYLYLDIRNLETSVIAVTMSYLAGIMLDHFSDIIVDSFKLGHLYLIVLIILEIIFAISLSLFVKYMRNRQSYVDIKFTKLESILAMVTSIIFCLLIFFTEIRQDNHLNNIVYNLILLILIVIIFFVISYERIQQTKREYELRSQKQRIKNDNRYIKEMEKHYNELRKFRHDYQNTLLSLDEYIKTDDIDGLKQYYDNSIKPISSKLNSEKYKLEDISRVGNKELKSILFNKLYSAQMAGIEVTFEARSPINDFYVDSLDLALALGIILDNAIEDTEKQSHGDILTGIMKDESSIMIIVQNSITEETPPVWKMKTPGYSTKGNNRGMGLANLTEIIDRNQNVTLETMKLNGYFLQKLNIKIGGVRND